MRSMTKRGEVRAKAMVRPKKKFFQKNIPLLSVSGQQGGFLRLWVRGWNETAQTRKRGILICAANKARQGLIL